MLSKDLGFTFQPVELLNSVSSNVVLGYSLGVLIGVGGNPLRSILAALSLNEAPPSNDPVSATPPPQYITSEQYTGADGGWVTIETPVLNVIGTSEQYTGADGGYASYSVYSNYNGNQDLSSYQSGGGNN